MSVNYPIFYSHLLSAKTDDMVYKCFLRIAADVLKIKLTARDIDNSQVLQPV